MSFCVAAIAQMEEYRIMEFIDSGAQIRNGSLEGQNTGQDEIAGTLSTQDYMQGVQYGKYTLAKQINDIIARYLYIEVRQPDSTTAQRAAARFWALLDEDNYKTERKE